MGRKEKVMSCCDIERKIRYDDTRFYQSPNIYIANLPFLEAIARNHRVGGSKLFHPNGTHVPNPYVFKVRCMGKLHQIIIWPDGAVTLTAHLGEVCRKRDSIYSWAGKEIGCREILKTWRSHCRGLKNDYLPPSVKKLAEDVSNWRKTRRHNDGKRWVCSRARLSNPPEHIEITDKLRVLGKRKRQRSDKLIDETCKEVFANEWYYQHGLSKRDGLGTTKNSMKYQNSVCLSLSFEDWRTKVGRYGLLSPDLQIQSPYPEKEGEGTFHLIPVLPVRVLDYVPYTTLVSPGNLLLEVLDKYGCLHLMEVQLASKPGQRKRWRVVKTWPSGEKLNQK